MTTNPFDWHQVLSPVTGELVRGQQRVTTRELLTFLGVPVTDSAGAHESSIASGIHIRPPASIRSMPFNRHRLR
jgi:hypothetical protein